MAIQTQMNLGRVRPVYKGAYNALAAYGTLDMVLYEKEIWMMVARSYTPGDLPVDAGNGLSASGAWAKIGYQGERGVQGETGPIGPYYRPSVAVDGTFSWTNDGGLVNPDPVKIDLYWHTISGTAARVSTTQFTVAGTESVIVEGRGVRINDAILTHIKSVSVANDVTTVTVDTAVVPATISKVEIGVISIDMLPTITGFLPLSGGTLTGDITTKNITMSSSEIRTLLDSQALYQYGGTGWQHGAQITLFGKDHSSSPGDFTISANNGTNSSDLFGRPDGTLLWNGKSIVNNGAFNKMFFSQTSGSYTAPYTGVYRITLKGGGGSGATVDSSALTGGSGGGEGGLVIFFATLTAGTSYSYTIGAGGAAVSATGTTSEGVSGGASSFNLGPGFTAVANGGEGALNTTGVAPGVGGTGVLPPSVDGIAYRGAAGQVLCASGASDYAAGASGGGIGGSRGAINTAAPAAVMGGGGGGGSRWGSSVYGSGAGGDGFIVIEYAG